MVFGQVDLRQKLEVAKKKVTEEPLEKTLNDHPFIKMSQVIF